MNGLRIFRIGGRRIVRVRSRELAELQRRPGESIEELDAMPPEPERPGRRDRPGRPGRRSGPHPFPGMRRRRRPSPETLAKRERLAARIRSSPPFTRDVLEYLARSGALDQMEE